MGELTPKTGQIAFSDLNTGILNAGSTASLNMNTAAVRLGFGSTAQVSISNLRGCTGGTLTVGYRTGSKFVSGGYGYDRVISTTGSATGVTYRASDGTAVNQMMDLDFDNNRVFCTMAKSDTSAPDAAYDAPALNRVAYDDSVRSIISTGAGSYDCTYTMPTSGTISWGLRFA